MPLTLALYLSANEIELIGMSQILRIQNTEFFEDEYEFSPLSIAAESESIDELKTLKINKGHSNYQISMQIRFKNDLRWHWLNDTMHTKKAVIYFIHKVLNHLNESNKISNQTLDEWKDSMNRLSFGNVDLRTDS